MTSSNRCSVGVPKEIKNNENRVALTPAGVHMLQAAGHEIVWGRADMIVKVKEPLQAEYAYFREGKLIFTYLHLAAELDLTQALVQSKVTGIAYETIQLSNGSLPLLTPMSEVAGRMSVQIGAQFLEKLYGGRGILLGGVPGVPPGIVVILGGGIVGTNAAKMALGIGADVVIVERSAERMRQLDDIFGGRVKTLMSNPLNISSAVQKADLLIGAVLIPGARAPKLVTETMVSQMKKGAVIVDVAVDQGGTIETIDRVTTHSNPTYEKHGVIHYAVANMPGAVPRTSTLALTNVTIPYVLELANKGYERAARENASLRLGVNTHAGFVTHPAVAEAVGLPFVALDSI
ncbi:MAG: ald [Paenibacillus sp.]|nr:ald [Paenibacillus sp.]